MATITVRGLDERVKAAIEERARENGRSMEAEARRVLEESVEQKAPAYGLGSRLQKLFAGVDELDHHAVEKLRDEKPRAASFDR